MADAHEEQLNVLTLLTNVICNGKKGWPDILAKEDGIENSHI